MPGPAAPEHPGHLSPCGFYQTTPGWPDPSILSGKTPHRVQEFPTAAVRNCHKAGGLTQHMFTVSQFWRSEVKNQFHSANSKVLAGPHSIWKHEGNIHLLALPDLRGRLHSLLSEVTQNMSSQGSIKVKLWDVRVICNHLYTSSRHKLSCFRHQRNKKKSHMLHTCSNYENGTE